jgi:hypothetical protein
MSAKKYRKIAEVEGRMYASIAKFIKSSIDFEGVRSTLEYSLVLSRLKTRYSFPATRVTPRAKSSTPRLKLAKTMQSVPIMRRMENEIVNRSEMRENCSRSFVHSNMAIPLAKNL